ncbi:hypothetical protein, partial [Leucobacter albus]
MAAPAGAGATEGCSYGTGGPQSDALCWIDFAEFGSIAKAEIEASPAGITKAMTVNLGNYQMTFDATVKTGLNGASGVSAVAMPTWGGSVLGAHQSGQDYYVGTTGKPALYQELPEESYSVDFGERDTVSLDNIVVTDTRTNSTVTSGYSLVIADAESTWNDEGITWRSDKPLAKYLDVTPAGWLAACTDSFTGIGTTEVTCKSGDKPAGAPGYGITMISADAPTTISSTFRNAVDARSREGVAFAIVFSTVNAKAEVVQAGGSDGEFTVTASVAGETIGSAVTNGDESQSGIQQILSPADGAKTTFTAQKTGGNTPESAYSVKWECTVGGEVVTPEMSADGMTATVTTPANGTATCKATMSVEEPQAKADSVTIKPDETATLQPET